MDTATHIAPQITLSPFYFTAVNALTKPSQMVFCSRYFVKRWMPALGGTGTQIVLYLRSLGYRQTGERRDEVSVKLRGIAAACGCSTATVRRELAQNTALQLFVQVRFRMEPDPPTGLSRQCVNGYRVAMDDPPTRLIGPGWKPTSRRKQESIHKAHPPCKMQPPQSN